MNEKKIIYFYIYILEIYFFYLFLIKLNLIENEYKNICIFIVFNNVLEIFI